MEEQYERMREQMTLTRATGTSGNGLVTVVVNGNKEVQSIVIKPECVDPNDLEGLQDLIKDACDNAYKNLPDNSMGGMSGLPF